MDMQLQKDIFIGFFRAGMLGYGGGPSAMPLIRKEVVVVYKWMSDDEFIHILALGNTLPGPIATKMAGYIGYRLAGTIGLINAVVATVLPTVLLMVILISFLASFRNSSIVQSMTQAITPVVGVMLAVLAYEFLKQSRTELSWKKWSCLSLISLLGLLFMQIHPALLIGILLITGFLMKSK